MLLGQLQQHLAMRMGLMAITAPKSIGLLTECPSVIRTAQHSTAQHSADRGYRAHGADAFHDARDDWAAARGLECDAVAHHKWPRHELQTTASLHCLQVSRSLGIRAGWPQSYSGQGYSGHTAV